MASFNWACFTFTGGKDEAPLILSEPARQPLDDDDLDEWATRASVALTGFQKVQKEWRQIKNPKKNNREDIVSERLKVLGAYSGESANLCLALRHLIDQQVKVGDNKMVLGLIRGWEAATKKKHTQINENLRKLTRTEDLDDPLPKNGEWIGSWYLGAGSFGKASVYMQLDDSGNIANCVVLKEVDYNQDEDQIWAWDNDMGLFSEDHTGAKIPMEVKTMYDLRGKQGSEYIVKILNWRVARERRYYRIYLEYVDSYDVEALAQMVFVDLHCPLRDLHSVVNEYVMQRHRFFEDALEAAKAAKADDSDDADNADDSEDEEYAVDASDAPQMPEPFLWYVFECLCIAGLLLERGVVESNPMQIWEIIVHRDLRPCNIFLGRPDTQRFSRYPTPKVGDFGLAVYPSPSSFKGKPEEYHDVQGPEKNVPPEQRPDFMAEAGFDQRWLLSSKTNVWGIANVVASMLDLKEGVVDVFDGNGGLFDFDATQAGHYSQDLQHCLYACMDPDPSVRPNFSEVLKQIQEYRDSHQAGPRDEPADSNAWDGLTLFDSLTDLGFVGGVKVDRLGEGDFDASNGMGGKTGTELAKQAPNVDTSDLAAPLAPARAQSVGGQPAARSATNVARKTGHGQSKATSKPSAGQQKQAQKPRPSTGKRKNPEEEQNPKQKIHLRRPAGPQPDTTVQANAAAQTNAAAQAAPAVQAAPASQAAPVVQTDTAAQAAPAPVMQVAPVVQAAPVVPTNAVAPTATAATQPNAAATNPAAQNNPAPQRRTARAAPVRTAAADRPRRDRKPPARFK